MDKLYDIAGVIVLYGLVALIFVPYIVITIELFLESKKDRRDKK